MDALLCGQVPGTIGVSFINRVGCWRTASKLVAFLIILVPVLIGFVSAFRRGLRSLVWGLRILCGQTLSVNELKKLNLEPSQSALKKTDISQSKTLIIEGLSMIEGCVYIILRCCVCVGAHTHSHTHTSPHSHTHIQVVVRCVFWSPRPITCVIMETAQSSMEF